MISKTRCNRKYKAHFFQLPNYELELMIAENLEDELIWSEMLKNVKHPTQINQTKDKLVKNT